MGTHNYKYDIFQIVLLQPCFFLATHIFCYFSCLLPFFTAHNFQTKKLLVTSTFFEIQQF